jgi:hypothetical protein
VWARVLACGGNPGYIAALPSAIANVIDPTRSFRMTPGARRLLHLLEIATVGFPFCAFKFLTGGVLIALPAWRAMGWGLVALGAVDLVLNVANFSLAIVGRESPVAVCTAQHVLAGARPGNPSWKQLGLSVDAMLSFTLVATMIGFGFLPRLSHADLGVWNTCVVFNVLGAGLGRLAETLGALRPVGAPPAAGPR